jgi:hypothetical protein
MITPRKAAYPRRRTFPAVAEESAAASGLRAGLEAVLAGYEEARAEDRFSRAHPLWERFRQLQGEIARLPAVAARPTLESDWSAGVSRWARVPWIALLDTRETRSTQQGVHAAYLFREDLSGVYLVLTQGSAEPRRQLGAAVARATLRQRAADLRAFGGDLAARGFRLDDLIDLRTADPALGRDAEASVVAYRLYDADAVPDDATLEADLEALLAAYERYLRARRVRAIAPAAPPARLREERRPYAAPWEAERAVREVVEHVEARGFVFEPWQVAAYLTALRTKPFVILAGVSGIGKSRLPALVAEAAGGHARLVPVRPDWTDSAETLGYTDLGGAFRPGPVLRMAQEAADHPARHYVCVLDEMNLARPEHFFAEVLSRIEDRRPHPAGGFASSPLVDAAPDEWRAVGLPPNLALVGTVNMDESAHGFSRKVLDRAFTLELSDVELSRWEPAAPSAPAAPQPWPMRAWHPRAIALGGLGELSADDRARVQSAVDALGAVNPHLAPAGLQAGYRTRDEMALFVLHAAEVSASFVDRAGAPVDPLDLALHMKILPRIAGGSGPVRRAVLGLLGWSHNGCPLRAEPDARALLDAWDDAGRPGSVPGARFPRTAARLCMMWERMLAEGFTSFWA